MVCAAGTCNSHYAVRATLTNRTGASAPLLYTFWVPRSPGLLIVSPLLGSHLFLFPVRTLHSCVAQSLRLFERLSAIPPVPLSFSDFLGELWKPDREVLVHWHVRRRNVPRCAQCHVGKSGGRAELRGRGRATRHGTASVIKCRSSGPGKLRADIPACGASLRAEKARGRIIGPGPAIQIKSTAITLGRYAALPEICSTEPAPCAAETAARNHTRNK